MFSLTQIIKNLLSINDKELEYLLIFSTKEKIKHQLVFKPQEWFDKQYLNIEKVEFATMDRWNEIRDLRKQAGEKNLFKKILYKFIFDINPGVINTIFNIFDIKRNISYYLFKKAYANQNAILINPRDYYHYLETYQQTPKIEWLDADSRIFYGSFQVLVDFIEFECARANGFKPEFEQQFLFLRDAYRSPENGIAYINNRINFWIQDGEYAALHSKNDSKVLEEITGNKMCESIQDLVEYHEKANELRNEKVETYTLTANNTNLKWIENWQKAKNLYYWFKQDFKEMERQEFKADYFIESGSIKKEKLKELIDIMDSLWV